MQLLVVTFFCEGDLAARYPEISAMIHPLLFVMQPNEMLDQKLRELNSDYDAKRYNNITMSSPKISVAQKGLFDKWLRNYNKVGGQHKIQRLSNDRKFIENLLSIDF